VSEQVVPNHHAHHQPFSGVSGVLAALSMVRGREGDSRLAASLASVGRGDVVVDVGCGPGAAARHAAGLGATVIGVDPAPVMLAVARWVSLGRNIRYVEGSAESVPLPDDHATVLWSIASVHHWTDVSAGLREARRVLRPGGRFVAIERSRTAHSGHAHGHGHASHGWTLDQASSLGDACRSAGFVDVEVGTHEGRAKETFTVVGIAP